MVHFEDLTGKKFGRLTVIKQAETKNKKTYWLCQCECGNEKIVWAWDLKSGSTRSCGCLAKETKSQLKHGHAGTALYKKWVGIKTRCYNSKEKAYKHYGARGIGMCIEWQEDYMNFYNWAINNGYKKGLTIDRIDVNKDYSPENCRWADLETQANNKRNNHLITFNGETHTIAEWSRILNISTHVIYTRWKTNRKLDVGKWQNKNEAFYDYKK
jgi:hypothetical protein